MPTQSKKMAATGLILLLAVPLVFSVVLIVQQKVLQVNSRAKFDKEIILTISLPKEKVNWVKKDKEILIDGKYFDVKSFVTDGDIVLLTGYYDHKQDKLVKQIRHIFQQKKDTNSPITQTAVKYFFFPVFTAQSNIVIEPGWQLCTGDFFTYSEKIPEPPYSTFSPPPKL